MWPFKRKPVRGTFDHDRVAELIRTTTRHRRHKLAHIGLDAEEAFDRVWLEYCSRRPFVPFSGANEAISWVAAELLKVEEGAFYRETVAAHG